MQEPVLNFPMIGSSRVAWAFSGILSIKNSKKRETEREREREREKERKERRKEERKRERCFHNNGTINLVVTRERFLG
jgi:hypothetical protein